MSQIPKVQIIGANQVWIHTEKGTYLQSYNTIIALKPLEGKIQLDKKSWNYSKTTSKHLNYFLNSNTKEIRGKISEGIYELVDLN